MSKDETNITRKLNELAENLSPRDQAAADENTTKRDGDYGLLKNLNHDLVLRTGRFNIDEDSLSGLYIEKCISDNGRPDGAEFEPSYCEAISDKIEEHLDISLPPILLGPDKPHASDEDLAAELATGIPTAAGKNDGPTR